MRTYYTKKGIVNLPKKKRLRNKVLKRVICMSEDNVLYRDNFFLVTYYDGIIKGVDTSGFASCDILSTDYDSTLKKLNEL